MELAQLHEWSCYKEKIIDIDNKEIINNHNITLEHKHKRILKNISQNLGTKNVPYNTVKKSFITKVFSNGNNILATSYLA